MRVEPRGGQHTEGGPTGFKTRRSVVPITGKTSKVSGSFVLFRKS